MKNGKYLVERLGLFGPEHTFANTIAAGLKKARVSPKDDNREFRIWTARNGKIVRISRNGNEVK
jgi:hypothetical protein